MSDDFNLDIIQNDAELEKLCTDSVELINYARYSRRIITDI